MSWMFEYSVSQKGSNHFAVRRENDDAFVGTGVDVARFVDHDSAVRRPQGGLPSGRSPQPGTVSKVISPQPIRTGWAFSAE